MNRQQLSGPRLISLRGIFHSLMQGNNKLASELFGEWLGKWFVFAFVFGLPALLIFRLIIWLLGMPGLSRFQWIVFIAATLWAHYDYHFWEAISRLPLKKRKK